jgi:hypothetical protein
MTARQPRHCWAILAAGLATCEIARPIPVTAEFEKNGAGLSQRSEKEMRTPAQQKINSQILYEIYRRRGLAEQKGTPPQRTDVRIDARGRALVDVRAPSITRALTNKIRTLGGTIMSVSTEHQSILAWVPLLKLESLAEDPAVRFIEPAAEAILERPSKER